MYFCFVYYTGQETTTPAAAAAHFRWTLKCIRDATEHYYTRDIDEIAGQSHKSSSLFLLGKKEGAPLLLVFCRGYDKRIAVIWSANSATNQLVVTKLVLFIRVSIDRLLDKGYFN